MKMHLLFPLCLFLSFSFISTGFARKGNQALAGDYCQIYRDTFPGKTCLVDPGTCPKGYRADKKFSSNGSTAYSACIKENKIKNLSKIGFRKFNKGSAEAFNTINCDFSEIRALNQTHDLLKNNWNQIVQEAKSPQREQTRALKPVRTTSTKWNRLSKMITGEKTMQVECKSASWCEKKGINGGDSPKLQHIYMCVARLLRNEYNSAIALIGSTIVHELAHSADFPRYEMDKHNCEDPWIGEACLKDDEVFQISYAAGYILSKKLEGTPSKQQSVFNQFINNHDKLKH